MPNWLNNAIFYEIYPQSFKDTNGDGIGDFNGIISKLTYIKDLGCNAIWINPCFKSPLGDAGYDVSDYYEVAPRYGTNDDLTHLFEEAHKLDMHVLLDLVPGHTSWDHEWFKRSCEPEHNEYSDRYIWTDSIWEQPTGLACLAGIAPRDGCCAVNFFSHQPALNYGYEEITRPWQQPTDAEGPKATLEEMKNIMRFWLNMGCDGFRVDMAGSLVKNDPEGKGTIRLWQNVRGFLDKEFPEAALISEWGDPDKSLAGGFHMDFLLHFGPMKYWELFRSEKAFFSGKGDISEFCDRYMESYNKAHGKGLICIPSGNHDMQRISHDLTEDEIKLAFSFILSMPGAPFIYYGDEIGMRNLDGLVSVEGGYGRTAARSPMQWDESKNAGFSTAPAYKLYITIDPGENRPTVSKQETDENSILNEVKRLTSVRRAHPALSSESDFELVYVEKNDPVIAYTRSCDSEKLLIVINTSDKPETITCNYLPEDTVYMQGDPARFDGKKLLVQAKSCGFYRI
ncbi:MAG: alpha-glucosidase C-terminal domain-containing protein [Oscillospiraceae bacterium]|nr:alpha-glucosidase C-terminal domain-containing protein [Oscillospiraceae bacterium]